MNGNVKEIMFMGAGVAVGLLLYNIFAPTANRAVTSLLN